MMTTRSRDTGRVATEPMIDFIRSLLVRRDTSTVPDLVRIVTEHLDNETLSFVTARSTIDVLKALPTVQVIADRDRASQSAIDDAILGIPEGLYAIGPASDTRFYAVDRSANGRWAGWIFLKVQAGDDFYPVKNVQTKQQVLTEIARDPRAAAIRYGSELGRCSICRRTLTNPESITAGIGPICAGKMGW